MDRAPPGASHSRPHRVSAEAPDHQLPHPPLTLVQPTVQSWPLGASTVSINVSTLFSLNGKTTLVTGASRGIGLMIAEGYLRAGAKVYISARKREVCDRVAADLSSLGPCVSLPADIATTEGRAGLVREIGEREEALHVLVNNAGTIWPRDTTRCRSRRSGKCSTSTSPRCSF